MKKVCLAALICGLLSVEARGDILLRSTMEKYEGDPYPWNADNKWVREPDDNYYVDRKEEDPDNTYQTQAHGEWSLWIGDPDASSYANAKNAFPAIPKYLMPDIDTAKIPPGYHWEWEEYMTEFYLWVPSGKPIDDMYLYKPTKGNNPADIQLLIHSVSGQTLTINVVDENGTHTCYLDSMDMWHKIQIHKKYNSPSIDLYFDGDTIGTYSSLSDSIPPDSFLIGTEEVTQDGEAFFDDFIITTPPTGEHPRLLFGPADIASLQARAEDSTLTPLGVSYGEMASSLISDANSISGEDSFIYRYAPDWDGRDTMRFPYYQPPPHSDALCGYWTELLQNHLSPRLQTLPFVYILTGDTVYSNRIKQILLSLSCWQQWTDPSYKGGAECYYGLLDASHTTLCVALAYDMVFSTLNNYERMTIQNSLLTLGIGQLYLDALYGVPSWDRWYNQNYKAVKMSSLGLASLAVYGDSSSPEIAVAKDRLDALLNNTIYCGEDGAWVEGILYGAYATSFMTLFAEANRQVLGDDTLYNYTYLQQFPYWRLYNLVPGGDTEALFNDSAPRNDYVAMFLLASVYNNGYTQWFLKQTHNVWEKTYISYPIGGVGFWLTYAPFLFLNTTVVVSSPYGLNGDYSPYGRHFRDIGWVDLRTGWNDNDYLIAFKSGRISPLPPYYGFGHVHMDNNNFNFGWNGKWFISSGIYGQRTSEYHNVVLVNDTLGQTRVDGRDPEGEVNKFYVCEDYGYLTGNAGNCYYDHTPLHTFQREIVLLNNQKYFVTYDNLEADNPVHIDWLLHTEMSIPFAGGDSVIIRSLPDYLKVKILSPDGCTLEVNDDPTSNTIHVVTNSVSSTQYLSVFYPYESGETPPDIVKIDATTMVGTEVGEGVVMFGKEDSVELAEYELTASGVDSTFNVLVDVKPNTPFRVVIRDSNMNFISKIDSTSTDQGTLSFPVEMGGDRIILVTTDLTPPEIDLNTPVGGEKWEIGGLKKIEWGEPTDNVGVDSVRVLFTSNYPNASWDTIATLDPETTYYNWEIPDVSSSQCRIKVIAFDRALNVGEDICDSSFEIGPLFSTVQLATAYNSQKKLYVDSFGNVYMVYHSGGVNNRVLLGHYSEKGGNWCQKGISDGRFPAVVAYSDDSLCLSWVWEDTLFFRKRSTEWANTGDTYRILVVSSSESDTVEISPPSIAVMDDTAHVVVQFQVVDIASHVLWKQRYGKFPLSDPSDTNWTNLDFYDSNVQEKGIASFTSSIDIDRNGSPHVAWRRPYGDGEDEVYYKVKTNGTWSQEVNISESPYVSSSHPFIDIYGDFVNIIWKEGNNICHRKKWLYGDWEDRDTIAEGSSPQIQDGCVITYSDSVPDKNMVFSREFDRVEWEDSVLLTSMYSNCYNPQSYLSDSVLTVVCTEDTGDIYKVRMVIDTVFIPWQKSDTHLATSYNNGRKIVRDEDGRVHIVYQSDGNIFYTYTDDSLFSCDFLVGEGDLPCISIDTLGNPWILWRNTSGDEILFSKFDYDSFTTPVSIYHNDSLSAPSFAVSEDDIAHISFGILNSEESRVIYGIFDGTQLAHIDTLDTYEGDMARPSLALDEETKKVMAVWYKGGQIYYREAIDKEWGKIEVISGEVRNSQNPQIDYHEKFVYVVWEGEEGDFDIYYASKPIKGSWTEPIRVSNTQGDSKYPVIGGGSHVVWEEESGLGSSIYYFKVGSEQREPENLSGGLDAYCPFSFYYAPPFGDPNLFVVWTQRDVPYKIKMIKKVVTSSGGKIESSSSNATGPGNAERLSAVDGDAYLAFTSGSDVMYAEYRDTLYEPVRLGSGEYPLILSSGDNTNIVWQDSCGIYSSVVSDGWSEPDTILTEDITYNMPLVVASSNHRYHIGRVTRSGNLWRIKHGIKRNNGFTESLIDSLYTDSTTSPVSMSRDRIGNIHIVWEKNGSIYYTNFVGTVYGEYDTLSNTGLSKDPSIDVYGGRARVVWEDDGEVMFNSKWLGHSWKGAVNISETPDGVSCDPYVRGNAVIWSEEGGISSRVFNPDVMDWGDVLQFPSQDARYPQVAFYQTPHSTDMWLAWTEGESAPYDVILKSYKVARVPYICLDLGKEEPSVFTVRRGGYVEYGEEAYESMDTDPTSLVYRILGLDAGKRYRISVTYYQESGEGWEMRVSGDVNANTVIPSNTPTTETQWIPEPRYMDGALTLCITKVIGDYAICSGIVIYEFEEQGDGGGAQTAGGYRIFGLSQNFPNPTRGETVIQYSIPRKSNVSLKIYDVCGRLIKTIVDGRKNAGYYRARWDGRDNKGRNVASGVYFARLTTGENTASRKLVIVR